MAPASHLAVSRNAVAWRARGRGHMRVFALLPGLAAMLAPAGASGDLYKWTDEQGRTVVSDIAPMVPGKASGLKVLAAATGPAAQSPAADAESAASPKEQELEARIEELERRLQEQQSAQQAPELAQTFDNADHYPEPAQAEPVFSSSEQLVNNPQYYPGYYAPPIAYTVIAVPARPMARPPLSPPRPAFVPGTVSVNRPARTSGPVFVGRPPQFVGPSPQFVGRPPQFVAQPPSFFSPQPVIASFPPALANLPAAVFAPPAQRGGGARHGGRR